MRAVYIPNSSLQENSSSTIKDEAFHHLVNVVRVRSNDEILVLNGKGQKIFAVVESIQKKEISIRITRVENCSENMSPDLLLVIPKKEALESMVKSATELGVQRLFLVRGDYSSEKLPDERRFGALLQSALEQSNNPWLPELVLVESLRDVKVESYDAVAVLDVADAAVKSVRLPGQKHLLVIGPEGGFSSEERKLMQAWPKSVWVSFPTPILRAPTAMTAAVGWWHGLA